MVSGSSAGGGGDVATQYVDVIGVGDAYRCQWLVVATWRRGDVLNLKWSRLAVTPYTSSWLNLVRGGNVFKIK